MSNEDEDVDVTGIDHGCFLSDEDNSIKIATPIPNNAGTISKKFHKNMMSRNSHHNYAGLSFNIHSLIQNKFKSDIGLIHDENIPHVFEEEVISIEDCSFEKIVRANERKTSHPRSLLRPQAKFKQTLTVKKSLLKNQSRLTQIKSTYPMPLESSKFRQSFNMKPSNFVLNEQTLKIFNNRIKAIRKRKAQSVAREKKQKGQKSKPIEIRRNNKLNISKKPKLIIDTKHSGVIVKVEQSESDVDVDILSHSEDELNLTVDQISFNEETSRSSEEMLKKKSEKISESSSLERQDSVDNEVQKNIKMLKTIDKETFSILKSIETPQQELILEISKISKLERFMHSEFFMQAPTRTPERYLKIRNHILNMWKQCKPAYLSKTCARNGLKKCGDVNAIGRIHLMMEQFGAINFKCNVRWIRPLSNLYNLFQQNIKNRSQSSRIFTLLKKEQRKKNNPKVFASSLHETNFTISHDYPTNITIDSSMIKRIKSRTENRTQFELIECTCFSKNEAPFKVSINLSCLLCIYLHSASSKLEIMGFLGGKSNGKGLAITRYKPGQTSNQTAISCEMCPVSQLEQSFSLVETGYDLIGWFHSHPNFPANPSKQDLKTQASLQKQFTSNTFIGLILSCLNLSLKCIYIHNDIPYELQIEIIQDYGYIKRDIQDVLNVLERGDQYFEIIQKFYKTGNNLLKKLSISSDIESIVHDII